MAQGFLDQVPGEVAEKLQALAAERDYPPRSYLFHEGDPSTSVLLVVRGLLRVDRTMPEGRKVLLDLAMAGDLVGELGVIDDSPRSATVSTVSACKVLVMSRQMFLALMHDEPRFHTAVLHRVVRRMRALSLQLVEASTMDAPSRVAARLVRLAEIQRAREGLDNDSQPAATNSIELKLPITQEELGEWSGLSREGAVKGIGTLRSVGLIETGRKRITILDLDTLKERAAPI